MLEVRGSGGVYLDSGKGKGLQKVQRPDDKDYGAVF